MGGLDRKNDPLGRMPLERSMLFARQSIVYRVEGFPAAMHPLLRACSKKESGANACTFPPTTAYKS